MCIHMALIVIKHQKLKYLIDISRYFLLLSKIITPQIFQFIILNSNLMVYCNPFNSLFCKTIALSIITDVRFFF